MTRLRGTSRELLGILAAGSAAVLAVTMAWQSSAAAAAELPVRAVTASDDDGNVPENTLDGDLSTRWSAEGDGQWIRFDLGSTATVGAVKIAWYRGDERRASFEVQVSATGSSWATVHSGESSGDTTGLETYDVTDRAGRYVRIVGHRNSDNDWNSITEVKLYGAGGGDPSATPTPTDTPTPTPTETPIPTPTSTAPPGHDPNGVRQIYPTRTGKAAPWTLGYGDWDGRFSDDDGDVSGSGKNTVVTNSGQVRMSVRAVAGGDCDGLSDHGEALRQGYMCSPNDWTNWELTAYVQLVDPAGDSSDEDWTFYGNGGRHTGDGWSDGCMGSAYKGSYHYRDAEVRWGKESWHVNYDYKPWTSVPGGIDYTQNRSKWLGMKIVRYQFSRNGQRGVRLEMWLDLSGVDGSGNPANNWQKIRVVEDHPDAESWGEDATECRAPADDQVMLWGGPTVTYRWDNTTSRIRLASAREIVPPTS